MADKRNRIAYIDHTSFKDHPVLAKFYQSADIVDLGADGDINQLFSPRANIVLINITNTGASGIQCLKKIRQNDSAIPVILISDQSNAKLLLEAMNYSIQGFIMAPFQQKDFLERIDAYIEGTLSESEFYPKSERNSGDSKDAWMQKYGIEDLFFQGQTWMTQDKYDKALRVFQYISKLKSFNDEEEAGYHEKSLFEIARCNMKLANMKSAVQSFQHFIKSRPRSKQVNEAWFHMGEIFFNANNMKNAITCYRKATAYPTADNRGIVNKAKRMLKKIENS